jgi:hypothetical protein
MVKAKHVGFLLPQNLNSLRRVKKLEKNKKNPQEIFLAGSFLIQKSKKHHYAVISIANLNFSVRLGGVRKTEIPLKTKSPPNYFLSGLLFKINCEIRGC